MTNPFRDDPIRADLADPYKSPSVPDRKPRPKRKPLPVFALGLGLVFTLAIGAALVPLTDGGSALLCPLAGVFVLVGMMTYEIWSWFFRD